MVITGAFFADGVIRRPDGRLDILGAPLDTVRAVPNHPVQVHIVLLLQSSPGDADRSIPVRVVFSSGGEPVKVNNEIGSNLAEVAFELPPGYGKREITYYTQPSNLSFPSPGRYSVMFEVDSDSVQTVPLNVIED